MTTPAADKMERWARLLLPTPFTIALLLTILTWILAVLYSKTPAESYLSKTLHVLGWWEKGLWSSALLAFTVQMRLILVLGHVLALTPLANRITQRMVLLCTTTSSAVIWVSVLTMLVGLFNWGLGLVFAAMFARKVADQAASKGLAINYGLVGAAGYSGMLVWHGGLSGSAPLKAAEPGHIASFVNNFSAINVPLSETIFSQLNVLAAITVLLVIPFTLWLLAKNSSAKVPKLIQLATKEKFLVTPSYIGAERLDTSPFLGKAVGMVIVLVAFIKPQLDENKSFIGLLTPDFVNFILLGLGLILHANIKSFLAAIDEAISGVSGILVQFPLYFGIIAVVKESGLATDLALYFSANSTPTSFPLFTFFSAAIINIFVPSGGGQWSVQAPILIETAQSLGLPEGKCIMAMAYGDQLTNMLQPFWALPLLGITRLKAKEILPYTLVMMLVATIIFASFLLFIK